MAQSCIVNILRCDVGFFSGSKQTIPASGFYAQPQGYQNLYNGTLDSTNYAQQFAAQNPNIFRPMEITGAEQNAWNNVNQGFTPTQDSLNSDLSMLMNPFNDYVIDGLNRESQGQNSLVNQYTTKAGQQGSNRSFLGSSDVEQNRLNNIGQFKQGQYNTALNQVFNNLVPNRRADAQGALQTGDYMRQLNMQQQQAPLASAQAQQQLLSGIPTQFGNFGSQQQTIKTGGGLGGVLGGIGSLGSAVSGLGGLAGAAGFGGLGSSLGTFGTALGMFSDKDLKQDIEFIGLENGHRVYKFAYKSDPEKKYVGVLAQEILESVPEAVQERDGYLTVNYDMIGVQMREAE